jgi:hypothetical protein
MRRWELVFLLILLVLLGFFAYFLYSVIPGKTQILIPTYPVDNPHLPKLDSNFAQSKQFYDNLRFPTSTVAYKINPDCAQKKIDSINEAFQYLQGKTPLKFVESSEFQLEVVCSDLPPKPDIANHYIAGEGGPTKIINSTLYSVILSAKISLYRNDKCTSPNIALHELLHVLGYDHNNDPRSILYPTLNCDQKVDSYFIDQLNELYSVEGAPDLKITFVNATKNGPYLSFGVEIANQGLIEADKVTISLKDGDRIIKDFSLDSIDIGTRKVITVSNLKISRSLEEVRFVVDSDNVVDELNEDNNFVDLRISK